MNHTYLLFLIISENFAIMFISLTRYIIYLCERAWKKNKFAVLREAQNEWETLLILIENLVISFGFHRICVLINVRNCFRLALPTLWDCNGCRSPETGYWVVLAFPASGCDNLSCPASLMSPASAQAKFYFYFFTTTAAQGVFNTFTNGVQYGFFCGHQGF